MLFKLCAFLIICSVDFASGHILNELNKIDPTLGKNIFDNILASNEDITTNYFSTKTDNSDSTTDDVTFTVDNDSSASLTEVTTIDDITEPVTGNEIVIQCPEDQSSLPENQLRDIINFFAKQINLIDSLNESYFELGISLRDQNVLSLDDYLTRFVNRPKHIDHLLGDLVQIRLEQIEPLVKKVVSKQSELNALQEIQEQHEVTSNKHLGNFEKIKNICALNCDTTEPRLPIRKRSLIQRKSTSKQVYCGSLKDVKSKVEVVLEQFKNEHAITLKNSIEDIHNGYVDKIEMLKVKLKEAAVQEFGPTMYEVLSLQDEYNHFLHLLKGDNGIDGVESQLSEIRKTNLYVDLKIEEFKNELDKFKKYCLNCDTKRRLRRDVLKEWPQPIDEPTNDLLENLLTEYIYEVKSLFVQEQESLFQELHDKIGDQDAFVQTALLNLQPIQNEVKENLEKEESELKNLVDQKSESVIAELRVLNKNSAKLRDMLEEALAYIQHTIV